MYSGIGGCPISLVLSMRLLPPLFYARHRGPSEFTSRAVRVRLPQPPYQKSGLPAMCLARSIMVRFRKRSRREGAGGKVILGMGVVDVDGGRGRAAAPSARTEATTEERSADG